MSGGFFPDDTCKQITCFSAAGKSKDSRVRQRAREIADGKKHKCNSQRLPGALGADKLRISCGPNHTSIRCTSREMLGRQISHYFELDVLKYFFHCGSIYYHETGELRVIVGLITFINLFDHS